MACELCGNKNGCFYPVHHTGLLYGLCQKATASTLLEAIVITLCKACGTSYAFSPPRCKICDDERQFVPVTGQQWVDADALLASHSNKWKQHAPDLFSIRTVPDFAIGQRAFLLRTPQGNILWDCVATLDDATKTLVSALGGLMAVAISHPHFYTTMQDWAAAFDAPVYLHASDREWIMRESPFIRLWEGDELTLTGDIRRAGISRAVPCCMTRVATACC